MPFGWGKGHQRVNSDALDSDTLAEAKSGFSTIQCNFTIPDNEPLGINLSVYNVIESIDKGSIAARNGKLQVGDTLVSVNGMATDGKEVAAMIAELGRNVEFVAMRKDSSRRSSIFGSGRRSSKSEAAADASPEIGGAGGAQGDVSPDM